MTTTKATLDGYFKDRYGDKLENAVPSFQKLSRDVPFQRRKKLGKRYAFPVRLRRAHGHTWSRSGDAFDLNPGVSGKTEEAETEGSEYVLREPVSYKTVSSAQNSIEAFGDAFDEVVSDMRESAGALLEIAMFYGEKSIGTVEADPGPGTTVGVVITRESWAAGLWSQLEGAPVDIYDTTLVTKRNANADLTITNIDPDTRTVTVTGDATDVGAIAINDEFVMKGSNRTMMTGVDRIMTNTGSLFGIDASVYSLWKANQYATGGGVLTLAKVTGAAAGTVVRGGMKDLCCYLSTYSWTDLNNDHAGLRRFAESTKGGLDLGTREITYYGPNGDIKLKPHPVIKAGEFHMLPPSMLKRVGSTDITFSLDVDGQEPNFFRELENKAGFELRCYYDQAIIPCRPACFVKGSGIVNASLP